MKNDDYKKFEKHEKQRNINDKKIAFRKKTSIKKTMKTIFKRKQNWVLKYALKQLKI